MSYTRSGTATAAGVINYVVAGLSLTFGVIFGLIAVFAGGSSTTNANDAHKLVAAIAGVVAVIALVVGGALLLIGREFMRGKAWARWTLIVLYGLSLLSSLGRMSNGGTLTLGALVDLAMLVLLFLPSTSRDFTPRASYPSQYSQPYQAQTHPAFLGTPYANPVGYQRVAASGPPAGWYADPQQANAQRYWDGSAWTAHVHPGAASTQ
jgi:hypothetical protein